VHSSVILCLYFKVEIALEADKIRMMDRLSLQKEQFERVVENLGQEVKNAKLLDDYGDKEKIVETINFLMDSITEAKIKGEDFNMREKVFGFVPTEYSILEKFGEDLTPFYKLWNMVSDFHNSRNDWLNGDFKELDGAKIDADVTDWWKTSYKLAKSLEDEFSGAFAYAIDLFLCYVCMCIRIFVHVVWDISYIRIHIYAYIL
jgi:dynein heavy chain